MCHPVVPVHSDDLRAAAETRDPEAQRPCRAVHHARREAQSVQLPAHGRAAHRTVIATKAQIASGEGLPERSRRELSELQRERDALAEQRVDPGGIPDQQDARCRVLRLTEEGRRFRSDFIRIAQDTNRQMEQGFSPEELAALHRYLERVAQNLAAQTEETEL